MEFRESKKILAAYGFKNLNKTRLDDSLTYPSTLFNKHEKILKEKIV